ncbi:MAG: hypothetical protein Q8M29_09880 [Bacteroidota bacterium]|nr:hypothetical protein [Bacteroidota bacterium]
METKFEIEIHYNAQKIKRILTILIILIVLSAIAFIIGTVFWDEYTHMEYGTSLRLKQGARVAGCLYGLVILEDI